eukprot:CAMPEP_0198210812 /NCGR_PEP_ID=MMETSP1445-20131203/22457_1 /TAXON_ID=36898 /ORGANISM="Pyramimonas sp., Strain CCMP2087" /LENGTH=252 /DNA_ID=CAMNT_0043884967 /DNA_START=191 /DNA_END=946 /DNA_ORIENTATION=-
MPARNKEDDKALMKDRVAEKAALQAAGITGDILKQIKADKLLCTTCKATQLGPVLKCTCKGGVTRPAADYDTIHDLADAAKARREAGKAAFQAESCLKQGAVQKEREKKKEAKGHSYVDDPNAIIQGDGDDYIVQVPFEKGPLGMSIERNVVSKIGDAPSQAADLKVQVGWVITQIDGVEVAPKQILKEAVTAMKANGIVKFGFRAPIAEGYHHCFKCDKFLLTDEFDPPQLADKGPGKQMCSGCEDFAEMW